MPRSAARRANAPPASTPTGGTCSPTAASSIPSSTPPSGLTHSTTSPSARLVITKAAPRTASAPLPRTATLVMRSESQQRGHAAVRPEVRLVAQHQHLRGLLDGALDRGLHDVLALLQLAAGRRRARLGRQVARPRVHPAAAGQVGLQ